MSHFEEALLASVIRINTAMTATIGGVLGAVGMWCATAVLLIKGGENVGAHLSLLSIFLPGYEVSWTGACVGAFWGAVVGATGGAVVYWSYSRTLRHHIERRLVEDPGRSLFRLPVLVI